MENPRREEIKAYYSRNPVHFHLPDTPQDFLYMLLKSVRGMTVEKGFEFLETQLKRSDNESQTQLRRIVKNPRLLFIFADLITIPMFEKLKLINFNKLTEWRLTVPCWLSVFMDFARDSYKYLALPPGQEINSILDIKEQNSLDTQYIYGFLGPEFHKIIEEAYKTHLAAAFFAFADPDPTIVDGDEYGAWDDTFVSYRTEVLQNIQEWSTRPAREKKYRSILNLLTKRITYLLDEAHIHYPYITKLRSPLPLACETFIRDLGTSLHENENAILEVSLSSGYHFFLRDMSQVSLCTMQCGNNACNIHHSVGYCTLICNCMCYTQQY